MVKIILASKSKVRKEILDKNQIISLTTKKTLKRISAVSPSVHCFSVLRATERSFIENQEGECFLLPSLSQLCWRLLNWIGREERA